jgi:Ca2+-binding EF-hand superfamily protein
LDLAALFHDIDHDKNGQVTLEDFLATVGSHDHHHHARHSRLLTSIFDNEQVIIEYKKRKAQNARKGKDNE